MSPPKLKKAGDGSKQQTETTARFIWNAKVSSNYYFFSAAAILTLTTLILVLPQNTLELTKITKISTAYAEISMSVTKETQFVRMKSRSLPELLSVICDGSEVYKNKLIEIGNIRTLVLEKAKSKYNVTPSNVEKEDTADLGESTYKQM